MKINFFNKVFQFAAWISAAAVPKTNQGYQILTNGFSGDFFFKLFLSLFKKKRKIHLKDSRNAFLFFSVTGFLIAGFLFFMGIFNLVNDPFFKRLPWNYFVRFIFKSSRNL